MITQSEVSTEIDRAERRYLQCFRMMRGATTGRATKGNNEILTFQPNLAKSIFRLDTLHSRLASERKDLVRRKLSLNARWFRARLRKIRDLQEGLATAASIGRSLGDAFAWIFYRDDAAGLAVHSKHAPIRRIPNTVGGRGEVSFIHTTQSIDGYFIIYHGITTMLRHGDISVFNIKTRRLAAIGELKTKRAGPKELSITVSLIGSADQELFDLFDRRPANPPQAANNRIGQNLPAAIQARLNRQMKAATRVIAPPKSDRDISLATSSSLQGLRRLLQERPREETHAVTISDSQVLVRVRQRDTKLSSRLFTKSGTRSPKLPESLSALVSGILLPARAANDLRISSVLNPRAEYLSIPGIVPLVWWPLPQIVIRRILFHRACVFSVLNIGSIIAKLQSIGLTVEAHGRRLTAKKTVGSSIVEIRRLEYFLALIVNQCYPEDDVIEMMRVVLAEIEAHGITEPAQIDLHFQQIFGEMPA